MELVRGGTYRREVLLAQSHARHPVGAGYSAGPGRLWVRVHNRFGGHCGGGLPACPSVLLKLVGRFRESAGRSGLVGFLATATGFYWHRPSGPSLATQRRPMSAVTRRLPEGPRPRRWCAGGLPRSRENQGEARSPREPGMTLCGERRVPGGRSGTMSNPAPRWGGAAWPGRLRSLSLNPAAVPAAVPVAVPVADSSRWGDFSPYSPGLRLTPHQPLLNAVTDQCE